MCMLVPAEMTPRAGPYANQQPTQQQQGLYQNPPQPQQQYPIGTYQHQSTVTTSQVPAQRPMQPTPLQPMPVTSSMQGATQARPESISPQPMMIAAAQQFTGAGAAVRPQAPVGGSMPAVQQQPQQQLQQQQPFQQKQQQQQAQASSGLRHAPAAAGSGMAPPQGGAAHAAMRPPAARPAGVTQGRLGPSSAAGDTPDCVLLPKRSFNMMLRSMALDGSFALDAETGQMLNEFYEGFVENALTFGCEVAKKQRSAEVKPDHMTIHLERQWNLYVPGFGKKKDVVQYRRPMPSEAHRQRQAAVRRTVAEMEKAAAAEQRAGVGEEQE